MVSFSTHRRRQARLAVGLLVATALGSAQALAKDFSVEVNQSKLLKLTKPAASVVVANPAIADVTVEGADMLLVLGRVYGTTNLMVLDRDGNTITNLDVQVIPEKSDMVTLSRGPAGQLSYNCSPRCERTLEPTDNPDAFDALMKNTSTVTDYAKSAAQTANGD